LLFGSDIIPVKLAIGLGTGLAIILQPLTFFKKVKIGEAYLYPQWTHVLFAKEGHHGETSGQRL